MIFDPKRGCEIEYEVIIVLSAFKVISASQTLSQGLGNIKKKNSIWGIDQRSTQFGTALSTMASQMPLEILLIIVKFKDI